MPQRSGIRQHKFTKKRLLLPYRPKDGRKYEGSLCPSGALSVDVVGHVDPWMLQRHSHIRPTVADKAMEAMDTPPTCSDPLQNPLQFTPQSSPLLQ